MNPAHADIVQQSGLRHEATIVFCQPKRLADAHGQPRHRPAVTDNDCQCLSLKIPAQQFNLPTFHGCSGNYRIFNNSQQLQKMPA
jgi:hypothetical protein